MNQTTVTQDASMAWISGGGTMGALIRSYDWASHPMGPLETWPQSLRTAVSICLCSRFPMILWWGRQQWLLYNDAYIPSLGSKHPQSLGAPGMVVWPEVWPTIGTLLDAVFSVGESCWCEDQRLLILRSGYLEESYHTYSYSPVHLEDGSIGGAFTAVTETTKRVLSERRLRTLQQMAAATVNTRTVDEACAAAVLGMDERDEDIPFACIYVFDPAAEDTLDLKASLRLLPGHLAAPARLHLQDGPWPLAEALERGRGVLCKVANLSLPPGPALPGGAWEESPAQVMTVPLAGEGGKPLGMFVMGINARRSLDDDYRAFIDLVVSQIATAISRARAYQQTSQRAEMLAALDHAKTLFFSNVSHEFRTPLTLMLGPIDELLQQPERLDTTQQAHLALLRRNALRLHKLVNALLDFSRIEAGRVQAQFQPTDLAVLTVDLASAFRSAVERAGMQLHVQCDSLATEVFVDRDMWEKIVLNLLSNAFKYTLQGSIHVLLKQQPNHVELEVRDTGVGIPAHELPRLFERFHRVEGAAGRTHEGSGIGLALVQELVKLHGGSVQVDSLPQRGTTFWVRIPRGYAHLPEAQVVSSGGDASARGADSFVEEALRWLPGFETGGTHETAAPHAADLPASAQLGGAVPARGPRPRIVLADDNADMRDYVCRLLAPSYDVQPVGDGEAALIAVRAVRPDLVISDVMMPRLDGTGFIKAVRADAALRTLPIILLSARAGEESRIEGLQSGADDYLVKPFSARELLARVGAHLEMARLRREADAERERLLERERAAVQHRDQFLGIASHELRTPITSLMLQWQLTQRAAQRHGGFKQVPDARFEKMMDTFSHQLDNLAALVDDLLDVSRIANGRLTIEPREMDLRDLVTHVIDQYAEQLRGAACVVSLDAPEAVVGHWDPKRIEQVVVNLLSNAAKYAAGTPLHVRVQRLGACAVLSVADQGKGISAANQLKIFERFERVVSGSGISGLGLGLYIVKEIVTAHRGDIHVESDEGQGATFVVELPLQAA